MLGTSKAAEMLLLNHKLSAREALQFGFLSELWSGNELETKIWPRIEEFSKLPKDSVRISKNLMKRFDTVALVAANENELVALKERSTSTEAMDAIISFMNRKAKL